MQSPISTSSPTRRTAVSCAAILCAALALQACSTLGTSTRDRAIAKHGSSFRISNDSAVGAWARLNEYLADPTHNSQQIVIATDILLQTAPALAPGTAQYTASRIPTRDDKRVSIISIKTNYKPTSEYDLFGSQRAIAVADEAAIYAHYGLGGAAQIDSLIRIVEREDSAATIVTGASATIGSAWIRAGRGIRNWDVGIGLRYRFVGIGVDWPNLDQVGVTSVPKHYDFQAPSTSRPHTARYGGAPIAFDVYGFADFGQDLIPFASIGYLIATHTYVDQSSLTGSYYASSKPDESEGHVTGGAGFLWSMTRRCTIGLGYNSGNGFGAYLGYNF